MNKAIKDDKGPQPKSDPREKIIDALMALAGEKPWEEISLADVADRAGLTLAQFRDCFPSKGAVLAGFSRRIDKIVLEGGESAGETDRDRPRDRLFDVLMRRFDAMEPYRDALKNINDWAMRDPLALPALNQLALNSLRFMLEAAGLSSEDALGALKLQGLALAWTRVFHIWLDDDSTDHAKTMAALDRELSRGEILVERAEGARRRLEPLARPFIGLAERMLGAGRSR
ncbi:TetR/AcrR family transcriptional regulator [Rhodoblastus acidophilus]|uniref:TetR/AcrR family transcriptional regulator n=1 Tax=Candidatus Rhodoblastus alkanivorans TaxID=2954117 RepID=A0ABS9ZAV9_9HYPH|nr:TetR/AcrR family transcriptional regulator [Candidatus Rhodoblastus alkanivorans]MCI4678880.1 TetR/AcrR family transcriptional regulator [Candidatus Rhodoblastus alkanivorans]MCI4684196.1 TetR/AcrR family transcriptional regulator [Candidatus Rhodoblastus alkanivorans]MDI4641517.1 TetR/AcrR family transcriptional regulator [Rhodoblastus acidophilus]